MRTICLAVLMTACGTSPLVEKSESISFSEMCTAESDYSPRLHEYLDTYREAYASSGKNDLPMERLDYLTTFVIVDEKEMLELAKKDGVVIPAGGNLMAYQKKTRCGTDFVYSIYMPDPSTMESDDYRAMMENEEIFAGVAFHEISHLFYGHVDNSQTLGSRRHGLMAAKVNDKPDDMEPGDAMARLMRLFMDEEYKKRLKKF